VGWRNISSQHPPIGLWQTVGTNTTVCLPSNHLSLTPTNQDPPHCTRLPLRPRRQTLPSSMLLGFVYRRLRRSMAGISREMGGYVRTSLRSIIRRQVWSRSPCSRCPPWCAFGTAYIYAVAAAAATGMFTIRFPVSSARMILSWLCISFRWFGFLVLNVYILYYFLGMCLVHLHSS